MTFDNQLQFVYEVGAGRLILSLIFGGGGGGGSSFVVPFVETETMAPSTVEVAPLLTAAAAALKGL